MLLKKLRRDLWRDAVIRHGERVRELEQERAALGDGWFEERERISTLIQRHEAKLEDLRDKLRKTA